VAIWQNKALNAASATGSKVSDAALARAAVVITSFLKGVNDGSTVISGNARNGLIHCVGAALITLVNEGKYPTAESTSLGNAYIGFAHDSLTLNTANGGSVGLQTSIINVLTNVLARAAAKNVDSLAQRCRNVLLDEGFNVADYIAKARTVMGSTKNADYGAWFAMGLANLAKINLQSKTAKIGATDIAAIIGDIKAWVTDKNHLHDMRNMSRQASLYRALAGLLKEVYAAKSTLGTDQGVQDNIVAIFGTISGLKDTLVKKLANQGLQSLVTTLKANGFQALAQRLVF
jgi:hypothetical protein